MTPTRRLKRLVTAAIAASSVLFAVATPPASASAATAPAQGIFESCPLDSALATCEARLATMHAAGLQVVVIPARSSLAAMTQYAAAAQGLGMSVMWELSDPLWWQQPATGTQAAQDFANFAGPCGCSANSDVLAYMVHWLAALPGTYGYYAADDSMLSPGDQPAVSAYTARIKQADAAHTILIGSANTNMGQQYEGSADMVGQEIYPVTTKSLVPQAANQPTWDSVAATAQVTQHSADQAGKSSAVILQGFTWGDALSDGMAIGVCTSADTTASCNAKLRYPSADEQLALRNTVLENSHPKLVLWFSFYGTYGPVTQDSYFAPISAADSQTRWAGLSAAIQAPMPGAGATAASSSQPAAGATVRVAAVKHPRKHRHHKKHKAHKKHRKHKKHAKRHK